MTRPQTVEPGDRAAIERLLGGPDTAWLVERVRRRILRFGDEPLEGSVQCLTPTDGERAAAARLVGPPRRSSTTLRVDLGLVERILRRGPWPAGLADAVQELTGPVVDRRAERRCEEEAWARARDAFIPAADRFPGLVAWWRSWCAAGGLTRVARAEATRVGSSAPAGMAVPEVAAGLVRSVADLLRLLPVAGEPLSIVARRAVGDAHGLDATRPLGRLALAVVWAGFGAGGPRPSAREIWAAAGVERSALASTALCLGVAGRVDAAADATASAATATATAAALDALRQARVPVVLTLEQVRSGGVGALPPDAVVHVCENPTIVEVAADRWARATGGRDPVLVCTSGQPSFAVVALLEHLTAGGAECRYHGDFDWAGLRIASALAARVPWVPWRFGADDYRLVARDDDASLELAGRPALSPWDPRLAAAMAEIGRAVEEEAVADLLVADLLTG